jgi:hypothetical protein
MRAARTIICLVGLCLLAGPSAIGFDQQPTPPPPQGAPLLDANHKRLQPDEPMTRDAVNVIGDPSKPGIYVYRNRFAPGRMSRPHFHDQDRYVTVIKGTWWTGEGDVFDPNKTVPIKAGGFMYHPAGFHHYDGAKDEEVIVQIMGMGPVKTTGTEKK